MTQDLRIAWCILAGVALAPAVAQAFSVAKVGTKRALKSANGQFLAIPEPAGFDETESLKGAPVQ